MFLFYICNENHFICQLYVSDEVVHKPRQTYVCYCFSRNFVKKMIFDTLSVLYAFLTKLSKKHYFCYGSCEFFSDIIEANKVLNKSKKRIMIF